ncbi:MAG: SufD family Fe-S cluster assembly protein [Pseudomonadota bacterium]
MAINRQSDAPLNDDEIKLLAPVGFADDTKRSATAVLIDHDMRYTDSSHKGVEILPLQVALERYDWVQNLMFNLIAPDENELLRQSVELLNDPIGHFVYVKPGVRLTQPVQTFTLMETPQRRQFTHNITVIGEGAEVEFISGAAVPARVQAGHHVSIEETYVRRGAHCRSISIERWGTNMAVDSYSRADIGENAEMISTQINLAPLKQHLSDSKTRVGANGVCNDQAIVFAPEGTERHFQSETLLTAPGARAESISRMVAAGGSISNRALLIGAAPNTSGFLGCDGLKLSDEGEIFAEPSLKALNAQAELSHEASVGMISSDKLAYLMASGLDEDSARDLIVQGFLKLQDQYVPDEMRRQITEMIAAAKSGGM